MLTLVSSLGLCSLKIFELSWRDPVTAASPVRSRVATGNSFPPKRLKSVRMVQSFFLRHHPGFMLPFQLAFV